MNKKYFKTFACVCAIIFFAITVLYSPIFTIKELTISGNKIVTEDYIRQQLSYDNANIFSVSTRNAKKKLSGNIYIKNVSVEKNFPNAVNIVIKERTPSAYVKYTDDTYLYIDSEGMILEVIANFKDTLPIVTGLEFKNFNEGKILEVDNKKTFGSILILSRLIEKYDMSKEVSKINLSELDDIHLLVHNIDVIFGDISDADKKIQTVKAVLEQLPDYKEIKATINLKTNLVTMDT